MTIKKGDFIELDFTATLIDDGAIFDTTNPDDAERAGMICDHDHDHGHGHGHTHITRDDFKPVKICVGEGQVLPGLDEQLVGLNIGDHDILLGEDNAFGKKDSKLLKLMPMSAFKKQKINPFIGLTVDMDGSRGVVRSVSGGRVIVDFNHPLSGKAVKYEIKIKRKIDDLKERVEAITSMSRLPVESVSVTGDNAKIKIPVEIPENLLDGLKADMERITGAKISFDIKKADKSESASDAKKDVSADKELKKEDKELKKE